MRHGGSSSEFFKAVHVIGICVVVIGVVGTSLYSITERKTPTLALHGDSNWAFSLSYASHAPISIDGNSQFTRANGVVSGSGTASNPYVIEGWAINASTVSRIDIRNASAYFIIRDCYIHGNNSFSWSNLENGIYLVNCINGIVSNNSCSNNGGAGVCLYSSSNCLVSNNNCTSNYGFGGVALLSSSNITVRNNSCSQEYAGIFLSSSSDNTLINNNCSNNSWSAIHLGLSNNNAISLNHLRGTWGGVYIASGSGNRIWNNTFIGSSARDDGRRNSWNSPNGYGNYWSNWTTPDNVAPFGRVDLPYNISGSAGAKDHYPLTAPRISDPPYTPAPSEMLIPILAIAVIMIVAVILVSFIFLKKRKERTEKPPSSSQ